MSEFEVAVAINYWDDPHGLVNILTNDTTYDYIEKFFIIDGIYAGREDEQETHQDFLEDLKSIYSKLMVVEMPGRTQIQKRNMYWKLAEYENLDFMIVLDSDEYMDIDPDVFNESLRTLKDRPEKCYPIVQHMEGVFDQKKPRLFKGPYTYRHVQNKNGSGISHGSLYESYGDSDTEVIGQMYAWYEDHDKRAKGDNMAGLPGIKLYHDKQYRSRDRVIADRVYYDEVKDR